MQRARCERRGSLGKEDKPTNNNRPTRIEKFRTMITGLQAIAGSNGTITLKGVVTKVADVVAALQGAVDAPPKTVAATATFHAAVAAEKAANKAANTQYLAVKSWALAQLSASDLTQLGLEVKQPKKPKVATKAAAQSKARATRAKLAAPAATTPKSS